MKNFTDILNKALAELKLGSSVEEAVSKWPESAEQLLPALKAAQSLLSIPRAKIPEPSMRRKFLYEPARRTVWFSWLHLSRFAAASTAALLLIASSAGTAYGAFKSLPGQPLFQLKKAAEQVHVSFVTNPVQKANLQLALAHKRVEDAQRVLSSPDKTPKQESAALQELSSQTKAAIVSVQTAVASSPQPKENPPIVDSLAGLAKQQQQLLSKASDDSTVKVAVIEAQAAKTEAENVVKAAAANGTAALTALSGDPSSVSISGKVSQVSKNKVTVEQTSFVLNDKTVIKNAQGEPEEASKLQKGAKVQILGSKSGNEIIALELLMMDSGATEAPEVKGASVTSASSTEPTIPEAPAKTVAGSSTTVSRKLETSRKPAAAEENQADPLPIRKAIGTFIPEDPAPQYFEGENNK